MHQSGSGPEIATRALKWMVVSQRPLEPNELIAAAELDPALDTALLPAAELDIYRLIQFCGGLLLRDNQLDVIRFSHLSVQEYLETESMNKYWDIINAQRLVMEACLWILQCPFPPESVSLYPYTACHWFRHCRFYQDLVVEETASVAASSQPSKHTLDVPSLRSFLASFYQPTASYIKWKNWVSTFRAGRREVGHYEYELLENSPAYPAFAAALGGLGELVSWLWFVKDIDINVRSEMGVPLLHYAISSGSAELVEQMITMGAEIHLTDRRKGTALVWLNTALVCAVKYNSPKIVSLLLDRGADINAVGNRYGTALGCAVLKENVELVSLLLDRGADINAVGGEYGTALGCTCVLPDEHGYHVVDIATLLLDQGVDVNIPFGGQYGTALGISASFGGIGLATLLMKHGANPDLTNNDGMNARALAESAGHLDIVQLLDSWPRDGQAESPSPAAGNLSNA